MYKSLLPAGKLSLHFTREEFACNHCGQLPVDPPAELLLLLEKVREHFNTPVIILGGYRCEAHNRHVGGAKNSQHKSVTAADITVQNIHPHVVHAYLKQLLNGTGGLGKYATFTHVDVRSIPARW
jgi:Uncharacterized protein conserved in bacteria